MNIKLKRDIKYIDNDSFIFPPNIRNFLTTEKYHSDESDTENVGELKKIKRSNRKLS